MRRMIVTVLRKNCRFLALVLVCLLVFVVDNYIYDAISGNPSMPVSTGSFDDKLDKFVGSLHLHNKSTRIQLVKVFRHIYEQPVGRGMLTVQYDIFHPQMGLGNMLFLYASLLGIAANHSLTPVILDRPHFKLYDLFHVNADIVSRRNSFISNGDFEDLCCTYISTNMVATASPNNHIITAAYLQSYKYFDNIGEYLRLAEFSFQRQILDNCQRKMTHLRHSHCAKDSNCAIVGVHIRRGDITSDRLKQYGFVTSDYDYLLRAMRWFEAKLKSSRIVFAVVGNDYSWNYQTLLNQTDRTVVVYRNSVNPAADLCFLSHSDHMIVTTGTFGWWAAYLAGGHVVYSKDYATPGTKLHQMTKPDDFFPPKWIPL